MRKPDYPERYYLDFDGFFASCEQFAHPHLRGKPVGVIPMEKGSSCVIAVSREAKLRGVSNVMPLREAQAKCPDMILWPQNPDLYRRAHNELLSEISMVAPIDAVKSIDEITGRLDRVQMRNPEAVGNEIKRRLHTIVGPWIACSLGYGANRLHAKMACKDGKPAGNKVWWPADAPAHLSRKTFDDVPGIGSRMARRLWRADIYTMEELLCAPPGQLRAVWRSVQGTRMWYALHGYDIEAQPTEKSMFGHSRILPPSHRKPLQARDMSRILLIKATRRMRLAGFRARLVMLGLAQVGYEVNGYWSRGARVPEANDYRAILYALEGLWSLALREINQFIPVFRVDVSLGEVSPASVRQLDLLDNDESDRLEQEALSDAIDALNHRYGASVVKNGFWQLPPGDHTGQKISYTRIPRREDAW